MTVDSTIRKADQASDDSPSHKRCVTTDVVHDDAHDDATRTMGSQRVLAVHREHRVIVRSRMGHDTRAGPAHARCGCNASARTRTEDSAAPAGPRLHISAVAFDRDDRPVADLRASDMEVWIGGFRVPIETLTVIDSSSCRPSRARDCAAARRHDAAAGPDTAGQGDRASFRRSPGARGRDGRRWRSTATQWRARATATSS